MPPTRPQDVERKGVRGAAVWLTLIIAVAALLPIVLLIVPRLTATKQARVGDGSSPDSYGFDIETLRVPREGLVGAGVPRDFVYVLDDPETIAAADVPARNKLVRRERRRKFLVSSDRVVGVVIDGVARAYPLRVAASHEIVNDTLNGHPIAVVVCPRTETIAVLDRRIASTPTQTVRDAPPHDSETGMVATSATSERIVRFGFSGLVYNNALVMYDRPAGEAARYAGPIGHGGDAVGSNRAAMPPTLPDASLWSPLLAEPIAGPARKRGERLLARVFTVEPWARFSARYPDATVITGLPENEATYDDTYARATTATKVPFPLTREPSDAFQARARVLAVAVDGEWVAYPFPTLRARMGEAASIEVEQAGVTIAFTMVPGIAGEMDTMSASPVSGLADRAIAVAYSSWFAWQAIQPEAPIWRGS